jgi:hypothetical protein
MRNLVIALFVLITASAAFAGPVVDLQTGMIPELDEVVVQGGIVTAVRNNGFFMSEDLTIPYGGVWVYTGTGNHVAVAGDLVDVKGLYKEYYDLSEIDVLADATGYANVVGQYGGALLPLEVDATTYAADPEPYEGCYIKITDGMMVTALLSYGEWEAESMDAPGNFVMFDDYYFDPSGLLVGDCFDGVEGCLYYSYGAYKLQAFDNLVIGDCSVDTDEVSMDSVKALYR